MIKYFFMAQILYIWVKRLNSTTQMYVQYLIHRISILCLCEIYFPNISEADIFMIINGCKNAVSTYKARNRLTKNYCREIAYHGQNLKITSYSNKQVTNML